MTRIAIIGTGFVADYYATTLPNHPELELAGAWDTDPAALKRFCDFYGARSYGSQEACLADDTVDIVVNLTPPDAHHAVSFAALAAGKHVFSEKPLATRFDDAKALIDLAREKRLSIVCAPSNALSAACRHVERLLAAGVIGKPRLVYAAIEDGPVFRQAWQSWRSRSGAPWPGVHEFEVGCTIEHAGYVLSWFARLFGPVTDMQAFSALAYPDKGPGTAGLDLAPDFSVGCLSFADGVVARVTCGLAAPRDRSLLIVGENGTLTVRDLWDDRSPVHVALFNEKRSLSTRIRGRLETILSRRLPLAFVAGRKMPYPDDIAGAPHLPAYPSQIDFAKGLAEQAAGIAKGDKPFFSDEVALHLTEIVLALSEGVGQHRPRTTF